MARPERFELPTYSSGGCRSIQLSYGRVILSLQQTQAGCSDGAKHDFVSENRKLPAAAAFAAFAAATSTATAAALRLGACFVHIQCAPTHLRSVQGGDRLFAILRTRHLHEAKAPRASGLTIRHDGYSVHLAIGFEQLTQLVFRCVEIQISNEDVLHAGASGDELFECGDFGRETGGDLSPSWNRGRIVEQSNARESIAGNCQGGRLG